jgi:hypothetical protein
MEALLRHRSSGAPKPLAKMPVARELFDASCKLRCITRVERQRVYARLDQL